MADRLVMPGFMAEPARWIGHFDLLALSSLSEQAPIAVIEAIAAGLPVFSPAVCDVAAMVSDANRPFVGADESVFRAALAHMVENSYLRTHIGATNLGASSQRFSSSPMVGASDI